MTNNPNAPTAPKTTPNGRSAPNAVRAGQPPLEHTPKELIPQISSLSVSTAYYRKAVLLPPHAVDPLTNPMPIAQAADLGQISDTAAGIDLPVQGVLLTHKQTWQRRGLALGNLLHSLCLAPGEATRIAMQDWTHRTRGTGEEVTSQQDQSAAGETQTRALQEVQNAVARESQHGWSTNFALAHSSQAGVAFIGISASASLSASVATAASSSDASRDLGVKENQDVHQSAEQHAEAARTRRASVVREVVESEQEQATTRIVANYNHMHALTIQYFEVVEVYRVETKVDRAQPCIFIPFALKDGDWLLERYPSLVADAAEAAGMDKVAAAIRTLPDNIPLRTERPDLGTLITNVTNNVAQVTKSLQDINSTAAGFRSGAVVVTGMTLAGPDLNAGLNALADQVMASAQQTLGVLATTRDQLSGILSADAKDAQDELEVRNKLVKRINEHKEYFNQVIWLRVLTPRVVHLVLKDRLFGDELLNDVIDPTPVAVSGNLVGFATTSGKFLAAGGTAPTINFKHVQSSEVTIPTGGLFAEAVLGQAVSAERIDLTRFWNWKDSPIPLTPTELKPVDLAHATGTLNLDSGKLDASAAPLRATTPLPDPAGLADLLSALRENNMFRDMSGLEAAKEVAIAAAAHAASGAQDAAKNANQTFKDFTDFAEKVIPMIMTDGASSLLGGLSNSQADAAPSEAEAEAPAAE